MLQEFYREGRKSDRTSPGFMEKNRRLGEKSRGFQLEDELLRVEQRGEGNHAAPIRNTDM